MLPSLAGRSPVSTGSADRTSTGASPRPRMAPASPPSAAPASRRSNAIDKSPRRGRGSTCPSPRADRARVQQAADATLRQAAGAHRHPARAAPALARRQRQLQQVPICIATYRVSADNQVLIHIVTKFTLQAPQLRQSILRRAFPGVLPLQARRPIVCPPLFRVRCQSCNALYHERVDDLLPHRQ